MWTEADRRLGVRSASAVAVLGLVYVAVGASGVAMRPAGLPLLAQVDPFLAVMEGLIILSAIALVVLAAAICSHASRRRATHARAGFGFMLGFACMTSATHFVSLSIGRQLAGSEPGLVRQLSFAWPTVNLSLDLLAWDLLLGLALLLVAPVFEGGGLAAWVRRLARLAGTLCLLGTAAPLTGRLAFQFAAIVGYAFLLPALCVLIAMLFGRTSVEAEEEEEENPA